MPINNYVGMGRLTAQPELKTTASGVEVTSFTIAIDRITAKDKEKITDFINCIAWRNTASFLCKWFNRGDMIAVTGSLQSHKWTDKEDKSHTVHEIVVDNVSFCGSKSDSATHEQKVAQATAPSAPQYSTPEPQLEEIQDDSDLPF